MARGKIRATRRPDFRLSSRAADTKPTVVGPREQPASPARESRANMAVPPRGQARLDRLKAPGHIAPTDMPQRAQPARDRRGPGAREAIR